MSSYIALNARVRATCLGNVAAILETGVDEAALMARASCQLREHALVAEDVLAGLDAPVALAADEIARLHTTLEHLGHGLPALDSPTEDHVLGVAAEAFEVATQDFLVASVLESIAAPDIDFGTPRVRRGEDVVTLDARRGNSALLVRVTRDGRIERDWLVSESEDCHALDNALDRELRRRGIDFDVIVEDHHGGRTDNARLFGPALARDAADPARGAVLDAERPLAAPAAPAAAAPEQTRSRRVVRRKA